MRIDLSTISLQEGKSYRLTFLRTTVDFICDKNNTWLYQVIRYLRHEEPDRKPWVTFKDLKGHIESHSKYEAEGRTIICLDNNEIIYKGPDKIKKEKK